MKGDPVPAFGVSGSPPSAGKRLRFFDFSYDPGGAGVERRLWSFGDGGWSRLAEPTHCFRREGAYTVILTVTTADGRTASRSQEVVVHGARTLQ